MVLIPFRTIRNLRNIINEFGERVSKLEEEKRRLKEENIRLHDKIKEQNAKHRKIANELKRRYEEELEIYQNLIESYERSLKEYKNRVSEYQNIVTKLQESVTTKEKELEKHLKKERVLKQKIVSAKKNLRDLRRRLTIEREEEKEILSVMESIMRKMASMQTERELGYCIEELIEKIKKKSPFYELSLTSKRGIMYHMDLDGSISASLIAQYLLEKFEDFPKLRGSLYRNLLDNVREFCIENYLEELFLLDIPPIDISGIKLPKKSVIITDKSDLKQKYYKNEEIELIIPSDCYKSTSELTYDYLKKKGFRGKNVGRLLELATMSHGKKADEEAKTIQYALELAPQLSETLIFEFAEYGNVQCTELWRAMDCCFSVACNLINLISRYYETLYEGENGIVFYSPTFFFSSLILSKKKREKGKNSIGIKLSGDEIVVIGRCKNEKDAKILEEYLHRVTSRVNRVHPDYVIATCPRDSETLLLSTLKEYCTI